MRDLLALVERDTHLDRVASTDGGEWAGPCPFCGGEDRFRVWPEHPEGGGGQWWCRQCGRGGDLIAYRVERGEITPQEAGKLRRNGDNELPEAHRARGLRRERKETPTPAPVRSHADAPPAKWQEQAATFTDCCAGWLMDGDNPGLTYLHRRGLKDSTIEAWGLGWHDRKRWRDPGKWGLDAGKKIYLAPGVVIPWTVEGAVYHVKFRQFDGNEPRRENPKYIRIRDGTPTLYGVDHLGGRDTVVICEGELDAALLWQEAGDLVDVVAIGTKGAKVEPRGLAQLKAPRWLVALDNDADEEAGEWIAYSQRAKRIRPLEGNDVTDFYTAGGDLRSWILHHVETDAVERSAALLDMREWTNGDRDRYFAIQRERGWLYHDGGEWIR